MVQKNEESPIESLQQVLDTPNVDVSQSFTRAGFHRVVVEQQNGWDDSSDTVTLPNMSRLSFTKKHHTVARWLFGVALLFFLSAFGVAVIFMTGSRNSLSNDKIDIVVTGPASASAGEVVPLAIEIRNANTSMLKTADLLIEYPSGTRAADDVSQQLLRLRMGLGDILPGSSVATTTKAIMFGNEGAEQQIVVSLEYRVAGSNAIFVKERAFVVEIDDSPVALSVDAPSSINSGDEIALELAIRSNSTIPIENLVIKAEYPFGFEFESSTPDVGFGETVWSLGDLEPRGERTVIVRGVLEGQNDEERVFRFNLGVEGEDLTDIGTSFAQGEKIVRIVRSFIDLGLSVDGEVGELFTARAGQDVALDINWQNNLSGKLSDGIIELIVTGNASDEGSLRSSTGFYDSATNVMTWDKRTVPMLALLDSGQSGRADVDLRVLDVRSLAGAVVNPEINLQLSFRGIPVSESDVPEQVRATSVGTIRIDTNTNLKQTIYHNDGPFTNSGPLPPRVETETTYTVVWEVLSSVNDVTGGRVVTRLPPYVSWKGIVSSPDEDIVFDPLTGELEWIVGTVRAGAGYVSDPRRIAFQIGFIPSVTQQGTSPVLLENSVFSGTDGFTGSEVGDGEAEQTILIEGDSRFRQGDGVVEGN